MKVDVITRHSVCNYGSLLQTFATQSVIKKFGYDSEIINYTRYDERADKVAKAALTNSDFWNKNSLNRFIYLITQTPNYILMDNKFKKMRKSIIRETENRYGSINELKQNPPIADVYCTGSDQVWGKIGLDDYDKSYFLEFLNKDTRCITYGASLGKEKIDKKLDVELTELLKKYEKILVREKSAEDIIKTKGFNNVQQVLDPTLLLSQQEWKEQAKSKRKISQRYILIYQLHRNREFDKYAKELAKRKNMKLIRVTPSILHIIKSGRLLLLPDLGEFLSAFINAEYILTDSFHATVFSIIFNKQFIDILPKKTGTRITSILQLAEIEDRILTDYNDFEITDKEIDYKKTNKILKYEREKSLKIFNEAIVGNSNSIDLLNKKYQCTGCRTCEQLCPKKTITMIENEEGFLYPKIDKEKCINCGLCYKKCPQLNKVDISNKLEKQEAYAAKNKNVDIQKKSSSGGIFSVLAESILEKNGVVYGASFDENLQLSHIRVDKSEELEKLRGSKYLQSNIGNTQHLIKQDLENGKDVLFVGTPCQVAGIRSYLGKKYERLLLVDLVCHGVPSQKIFDKYIEWIENKEKSKIKEYYFRSKDKGDTGRIKYVLKNGKSKICYSALDVYYNSFGDGKISRESCYKCKYVNIERVGDITIADYWGIEKEHPNFYDDKGVSAVIVNTIKGQEIFEKIKHNIEFIKSDIEKVKRKNHNLYAPTKRSKYRKNIYTGIEEKKFKKFTKENLYFKKSFKDIIKMIIPVKIKKKIKQLRK